MWQQPDIFHKLTIRQPRRYIMHLRLFICTIFATFAILTNAMAIDNCYTTTVVSGNTICGKCEYGYYLAGLYSCYTGSTVCDASSTTMCGGSGYGSVCLFACEKETACTESSTSSPDSNGKMTITYKRASTAPGYCVTADYCIANPLTATATTSTDTFCASLTDYECANSAYSTGSGCTQCPQFKLDNNTTAVYREEALINPPSVVTYTGGKPQITDCHVEAGTYYTKKGKFKITSKCNYSN